MRTLLRIPATRWTRAITIGARRHDRDGRFNPNATVIIGDLGLIAAISFIFTRHPLDGARFHFNRFD
ncbi:hypothetical protein [Aureimonas sp. AU40]|uniref:hypothetical protein n=1 Tax=Aureimonas sp. AU40 TaxID=1637747 RepID=UPI000782027F|nr:hypothetical protein [Aureimonas sp. AU40]